MRAVLRWAPLLVLPLVAGGCLMSEQAGKPPDDVTFHYLSVFNVLMLLVRVALVGVLAKVVLSLAKDRPLPWPILVPSILALLGSVYLTLIGAVTLGGYRIRCGEDELTLHVPLRAWRTVPWNEVHGLDTRGLHHEFEGASGSALFSEGYTEWERATVLLSDRDVRLNMTRFSPEQRGNLAEIIEQRAKLLEVYDTRDENALNDLLAPR